MRNQAPSSKDIIHEDTTNEEDESPDHIIIPSATPSSTADSDSLSQAKVPAKVSAMVRNKRVFH